MPVLVMPVSASSMAIPEGSIVIGQVQFFVAIFAVLGALVTALWLVVKYAINLQLAQVVTKVEFQAYKDLWSKVFQDYKDQMSKECLTRQRECAASHTQQKLDILAEAKAANDIHAADMEAQLEEGESVFAGIKNTLKDMEAARVRRWAKLNTTLDFLRAAVLIVAESMQPPIPPEVLSAKITARMKVMDRIDGGGE